MVPYCSQDLYLGRSGGNNDNATYNVTEATGFSMAGDAIFEAALNQWGDESLDVDSDKTVGTLTVVGISAGGINPEACQDRKRHQAPGNPGIDRHW